MSEDIAIQNAELGENPSTADGGEHARQENGIGFGQQTGVQPEATPTAVWSEPDVAAGAEVGGSAASVTSPGADQVQDADQVQGADVSPPSADSDGAEDSHRAEDSDDAGDSTGSGDSRDVEDSDDEPENSLENEGEIAADYLEELLDIADFDGDIDTFVESNRPHVSILAEGDLLVGRDGEVLEALQELSRLAVLTETGNRSRLMLDVAGYRENRRKVLVGLAADAVEEVTSSGESVRLAPMNPFERKIIHDAVAAAGLTSESEGQEPDRRVVILPRA